MHKYGLVGINYSKVLSYSHKAITEGIIKVVWHKDDKWLPLAGQCSISHSLLHIEDKEEEREEMRNRDIDKLRSNESTAG